jgi:alkylation response protein AidB-like acyl-CoA dehydrogenase
MDFALTKEQEMWREAVRVAEREVVPAVAAYDRDERYPVEVVKRMGLLGMLGGVIPQEYGGAGIDHVTLAVGIETMSRYCIHMGSAMGRPSGLVGSALLRFGSEEQKRKYLIPVAQGMSFGGTAVTEPRSGTDVAGTQTRAVRRADHYLLNGAKTWISGVGVADWFLTFATLDPALGPKGLCAFLVEVGSAGFSLHPIRDKVGFRPAAVGELVFEDCVVPRENRVGGEGEGLRVALSAVENGRLSVAARAVGLTQACLDESVRYATERVVGTTPIGRLQLVQAKIADMAVGLDTSRHLTYRLAWRRDQGVERARAEAAMAKLYATDVAMRSAVDAMQIFGAYGCSSEYPVGRYFRDAKFLQIVEGVNDIQRVLVAEYALGYRRDPQ